MCGAGPSCDGNTQAPTCDVANSHCICGTAGVSTTGCTVAAETCHGGACMCGSNPTCTGNAGADGCDAGMGRCTCGGNRACDPAGLTPTCTGAICVAETGNASVIKYS